jgi:hypothetical protein
VGKGKVQAQGGNGSVFFVSEISRKRMNLLSLSKKSKWPIPIVFAPLKINNLQAAENGKMPRFKVFRQSRYIPRNFKNLKSYDMQTIYATIWANF